ncbi:TIGR02452 family protein [Bacillus mexicanus]
MNFASAKNPGGGFLRGSNAQEESLARSSGLYVSISTQQKMYEESKKCKNAMYTDYMIYSPDVPVFRDDDGGLIEPYNVSFITSPAVNTGIVKSRDKHITQYHIDIVMKKRIEKILAAAIVNGHKHIVLGAFGCGVFKNSPEIVAKYFDEILIKGPRFKTNSKKLYLLFWIQA